MYDGSALWFSFGNNKIYIKMIKKKISRQSVEPRQIYSEWKDRWIYKVDLFLQFLFTAYFPSADCGTKAPQKERFKFAIAPLTYLCSWSTDVGTTRIG